MKITEETPIHYFTKNQSNDSWNIIELESYLEVPQKGGTSNFSRLEDIRLFISKDMENHEVILFHYDGGRNDCTGHWAKNAKELIERQESDASIYQFKNTNRDSYLELRNEAFKIYLSHPKTDFERLTVGSEYNL